MKKPELTDSQRVLVALKQMRSKLEAVEAQKNEPIAIVGMDCRFPGGANNPAAYWHLLRDGVDGIIEIPTNRWEIDRYYNPDPEKPGKMYVCNGGFLDEVDKFDPFFFGISPREAVGLDPQQRLLLEVSYSALENSGLAPESLKGSKTGVFVGICFDDYARLIINSGNLELIDAYTSLGTARNIAVGRLSYIFGLTGPTMQLDTSCSSSLLAIHLACQSLRSQESDLALAGGVSLMLSPEITIGFCKLKALARDGRCKTFDEKADGYARGEGCGIVVLKRLSDAIANGDNILALIRGSAVNHDGQSNGLTAPSGSAQEAVISQALLNAKVEPTQIQYVEAHGTGTSLGDPIEVLALSKVLGQGRAKEKPLLIGSVKTNFGHLEGAAGIAGLIKIVLSMQHQQIPPHLNFNSPNPYIPWQQLPVVVPTKLTPWSKKSAPLLAGVSSFGMSGTNVHIILEEAPNQIKIKEKNQDLQERPLHLLTLSAKTENALAELVSNYQTYLENNPELALADICYTANIGRDRFSHRLAVIASSQQELAEKLSQVTVHSEVTGVFQGQLANSTSKPKVAFLFTGQGSQYLNMGRQLYETQPVFRQTLEECNALLQNYLESPLLEVLYHSNTDLLQNTAYTQPALFAIEYALVQLWQSWGIKPDAVLGHSLGEYVAACVAGVFSLEEGLRLIAARGKLMSSLPPVGTMVAVMASESVVAKVIAPYPKVAIAALNAPESLVISGDEEAIASICKVLAEQGVKTKPLQVSHAFHSPLMEPMLTELEKVAEEITYSRPLIPLISNLTGKIVQEIAPEYWVSHARQPVRWQSSMATLYEEGYEVFLEVGPQPILLGMGRLCLPDHVGVWLPSLRQNQDDWQQILESVAQLYLQGLPINCYRNYSGRKVLLPNYPWQRQRYWVDASSISTPTPKLHPLIERKFQSPVAKEIFFETRFSIETLPILTEHRVYEQVTVPGAGHI
ncbi:MAG: type I polyketide synthase, partial [Moorea sp. SIO2I5]|nr:type I polyketide synthase [Moorena sp. SIO2I5]